MFALCSRKVDLTRVLSIETKEFRIDQECNCEFKTTFQWNCGRYYECAAGEMWLRFCPNTTHFSEITGRCEFPHEAHCNETEACIR